MSEKRYPRVFHRPEYPLNDIHFDRIVDAPGARARWRDGSAEVLSTEAELDRRVSEGAFIETFDHLPPEPPAPPASEELQELREKLHASNNNLASYVAATRHFHGIARELGAPDGGLTLTAIWLRDEVKKLREKLSVAAMRAEMAERKLDQINKIAAQE